MPLSLKKCLMAALAASTALVGFVGAADSATNSSTFIVSTHIPAYCTLGFSGGIQVTKDNPTGYTTMTVNCTSVAATPTISFLGQNNDTNNKLIFRMKSAEGNFIAYRLFGSSSSLEWTGGGSGTGYVGGTGASDAKARVLKTGAINVMLGADTQTSGTEGILNAPVGIYSDLVTATIEF